MRYYVGGVNGSGKSAFLNKLRAKRPEWLFIQSSSRFMEYLGISGDYETLRALPRETVNAQFSDFMTQVLDGPNTANLVVDAHYLNLIAGNVYEVIRGSWIARFGALVLITASAQDVLNRIENEAGVRDRMLFSPGSSSEERYETIARYITDTEAYCRQLADIHHVPFVLLTNTEGQMDELVDQFLSSDQQLRHNLTDG